MFRREEHPIGYPVSNSQPEYKHTRGEQRINLGIQEYIFTFILFIFILFAYSHNYVTTINTTEAMILKKGRERY